MAQNALMIDPRRSAFFGAQDAGSGSATMGNGNGTGWLRALQSLPGSEAYYTPGMMSGDSEQSGSIDPNALNAFLQQRGYAMNEVGIEGDQVERWLSDANGADVGERDRVATDDQNFWTGGLLAGALAGGATAGWAAAGNGIGGAATGATGSIGAGTGAQGGLTAMGTEAAITLPEVAGANLATVGGGGGLSSMGTVAASSLPEIGGGSLATVNGGGGSMNGLSDFFSGKGSMSDYMRAGSTLYGMYANDKATDASVQGQQAQNALLTQMHQDNRADNKPLIDMRNAQLPAIQNLLSNPNSITQDPGYQFGLKQGQSQIDNGAAARGGYYSGAQMKASQRYGQDYAGTKLNDSLNRLMGVANLGQIGATQQQQNNNNFGTQSGNSLASQGNTRGSGYMGQANTVFNGVNGGLQDYYWNQALKGGGG